MNEIDDKELIDMHRCMVRSRVLDERMTAVRTEGGGVWYSSLGCEATVVGSFYGLEPDDVISPHYRNYASGMLVRGLPMTEVIGNFMGRRPQVRRWEDHGIIPRVTGTEGTYIPISAGVALAAKLKGEDRVVVAGCGDGSTGLGDFHEGINLAAVLELPWVLVVLNNQVYMHVPISNYLRTGDVAGMAASYGIPGVAVDGNDLLAVHGAVQDAVARARSGEGPTLVECRTFRMGGHFDPDPVEPEKYWPEWQQEYDKWMARDPIALFEGALSDRGLLTAEGADTVRQKAEREFDESYATAENFPPLDEDYVSEIKKNVFSGGV